MGRGIFGIVGSLALALGGAAVAAPQTITQPDWITRPRAEDLEAAYPKAAAALEIEGRASVECAVDAFGVLQACKVANETPKGLGFGAGALSMTPLFRMSPMAINGEPVDGGRIAIPIAFRIPKSEVPAKPTPAAATPETRALAARLVALNRWLDPMTREFARRADELEFIDDGTSPTETLSAASSAYRAAAKAREAEMQAGLVNAVLSVFTPAELKTLVTFQASEAGRVLFPDADVQSVISLSHRDHARRVIADAGESFCRTHACQLTPAEASAKPATIEAPRWLQAPSFDEIAGATPPILTILGRPGGVRLVCKVDARGTLEQCEAAAATPAGLGLAAASIRLAERFRLDPVLMAQGAQGETVAALLVFPGPSGAEPFTPPTPRSPRALALAREVVELRMSKTAVHAIAEETARQLLERRPAGADPAAFDAAVTAFREASVRQTTVSQEQVASTFAALFSEEQLSAALAFRKSAAWAGLEPKLERVAPAFGAVGEYLQHAISVDARATFCKARTCGAASP